MADIQEVIQLTRKYIQQRDEVGDLQFLFNVNKGESADTGIVVEGNTSSDLVFLGSFSEDESSFVGKGRELLFKIVAAIDMKPETVCFISVKQNASVTKEQLLQQVIGINSKVVCVMDDFSVNLVQGDKKGISAVRGNFLDIDSLTFMPTYHPNYLLKNPKAKAAVWEDMQKVRDYIKS